MDTTETPVKPAINLAALAAELTEAQIAEILHLKSPTHIKGRLVHCIAVQWSCHTDGALYGSDFIGVSMHAGSGFCAVNQATVAAEAAERERIRLENERLKREAFEAEKAAQAERERVAKEKAEAAEKARKEREEIEAAMLRQKLESEAKAKAAADAAAEEARKIKAEADRLAKIAADKAKAEREAIEAKARAERETADKKAEAEREELRRQAKAAADAQAKAESEAKAIRDAEAAKAAAEEAARRKAASAPDRDKVLAFAEFIRAIPAPMLTTEEGKALQSAIAGQIVGFADWLAKKGGAL